VVVTAVAAACPLYQPEIIKLRMQIQQMDRIDCDLSDRMLRGE